MGKPEGYRKAVRLIEMAGRFGLPVITLVDTSGAFPGKGGEERGQAEALARSIEASLTLDTPMISVIVGEGGSGGAVALASGNKVLMMEHAVYSVISPEGAASILFHDAKRAKDTAEAMKITAQDLRKVQDRRRRRARADGRGASRSQGGDRPCRRRHRGGARQS